MKTIINIISLIFIVSNISTAYACEGLLREGVFNQIKRSYSDIEISSAHRAMCREDTRVEYSSTDRAYGVKYIERTLTKFFGLAGDAKSAQERLEWYKSNVCESSSNYASRNTNEQFLSSWVDQYLVQSYLDCKKLSAIGIDFKHKFDSSQRSLIVTVDVKLGNRVSHLWGAVASNPPGLVNCQADGIVSGEVIKDEHFVINCYRDEDQNRSSFVVVSTTAGSYSIEVPALSPDESRSKLIKDNEELRLELERMQRELLVVSGQRDDYRRSSDKYYTEISALKSELDRDITFYNLFPCNPGAGQCRAKAEDMCRRVDMSFAGMAGGEECEKGNSGHCGMNYVCRRR